VKKIIHQIPWYKEGAFAGFVQMARRTANVYYVQTLFENPRRLAFLKWLGDFGRA